MRNTLLSPVTDMRNGRTYSDFAIDENCSFFQKAVRRGDFHGALQCVLEAVMSGAPVETNILKRIYVILSEDIGPANPSLIMLANALISDGRVDQEILAKLVELMVKSPKDRLFDWVACCVNLQTVEVEVNEVPRKLRFLLTKLETELEEQDFRSAALTTGQIYVLGRVHPNLQLSKDDWKRLRDEFEAPSIVKRYQTLGPNFWLPVIRVAMKSTQKVCNLVCYLHNIACARSGRFQFRGSESSLLFWIHAVWSLCHPQRVETTWFGDGVHLVAPLSTAEERLAMIEAHRRRENIVPIPDHALDKHTRAGVSLGRGLDHFILCGARLRNVWADGKEEQMKWLNACLEKWKERGDLEADFSLPTNYF